MEPQVIIATFIPFVFFGLIFGIVYIRNKENMALIERGINPRQQQLSAPRPFSYLKYGLLLIGAGMGLLLAYLLDTQVLYHQMVITNGIAVKANHKSNAIYFALIGIGGGVGLVLSYMVEKKYWLKQQEQEKL